MEEDDKEEDEFFNVPPNDGNVTSFVNFSNVAETVAAVVVLVRLLRLCTLKITSPEHSSISGCSVSTTVGMVSLEEEEDVRKTRVHLPESDMVSGGVRRER